MALTDNTYLQEFAVSFRYPVHFGRNLLAADNDLLAATIARLNGNHAVNRVQVFIDSGVVAARPCEPGRIHEYFSVRPDRLELVKPPEIVPGGEKSKNDRSAVDRILQSLAEGHLCRQSAVIVIGGGSVLDIAGLAVGLAHRGLRLIRMPTSVLAQNDSGVGVKNGIDAYGMKNFIGTFAPPAAVLIDFDYLSTLPDKYWFGGLAEACKVALIKDAGFFEYLRMHTTSLRARCDKVIERVIRQCAELHLNQIRDGGDPFESGSARPLDFGHWAAHRLEIMSDYAIGHGQAVAIGIALDSHTAWRRGLITWTELDAILTTLTDIGLPIWTALLERRTPDGCPELQRGLADFHEHLGGRPTITLPRGIGQCVEIEDLDWSQAAAGIEFLKNRSKPK